MNIAIDVKFSEGLRAHQAGQYEEADRYYTAILKLQPGHPDANHNMGILAVHVRELNRAISFFKKALETNPSIEQFWISYINALIDSGFMKEAKRALKKAKKNSCLPNGLKQLQRKIDQELSAPTPLDTPNGYNTKAQKVIMAGKRYSD